MNGVDECVYILVGEIDWIDWIVFFGKVLWCVKNVKGVIKVVCKVGYLIDVFGGICINFKMGFWFMLDLNVCFYGMVDDEMK